MAGALHGVLASLKAAAGAATDAFFRYVTLLLNTTSTNGAQNNTFLDSSTNNFSITRNGNTTQGTFSPFSQTGWSNFFDGTGDFLSVADNVALQMGSGDFTIEFWWNPASIANFQTVLDKGYTAAGGLLLQTGSGNGTIVVYAAGTTVITASSGSSAGAWDHYALVRSGTTMTLYRNGASVGSATNSTNFNSTASLFVGGSTGGGGYYVNGYLSNFRIVKGTAVYTSNFTPPTSPLTAITNTSLLTCQSNRFIDNSSNAFAITRNGDVSVQAFSPFAPAAAWSASTNGGSGYFDGTGDYLTAPDNAAFDFGSGDFTVEMWYYPQATPAETTLVSKWNAGTYAGTNQWLLFLQGAQASGIISIDGTNAAFIATGPNVVLSQWNHIAFVRNGNNFTVYTNGVGGTAQTNSGSLYALETEVLGIGYRRNNGFPVIAMQGYASQVRIVKGTAVYTANFTPPTAPLTAITNTSLLLNFTNAGIFDSASGNDLETVGNAQVSTVQSKWGTTSMGFDGTGDWLFQIDRPALRLGTAAFTIEMWVYRSASGTYGLISKGTSTTGWSVSLNASNQVVFSFAASSFNSTGTVAATTWTHVAVVREGTGTNQTKIYINGTNDGTGTVATDFSGTDVMYVGADRVAGSAFNGYIDDLRVTNGYARYTANFTAPTAAFPLQ